MDRISAHDNTSAERAFVALSSAGRGWNGLEAAFVHIPAGLSHVQGTPWHRLGVHFGRSVNADCRCDGRRYRRVQAHGDIDIVPAGLDGAWEDDADCSILRLCVSPALLRQAAADLGHHPDGVALTPQFQLRDTRIEAIAWAIKAELEAPTPSDRLYAETLGMALAIRLLETRDQSPPASANVRQTLSPRQSRLLTEYIETHLDQTLSLIDLAAVARLSVSHLKALFRSTFGAPVHQYVLRRRVERARSLLLSTDLPMAEIALAAGFAHQSHMANCFRRMLGQSPSAIARIGR